MNKKLLLFCSSVFFSLHAFAMHVVDHRKQHLRGRIRHDVIEVIKRPILFYAAANEQPSKQYSFLPQDLQNKIFNYMTFNSCAESLNDAVSRINKLVGINRYLNQLINDKDKCLVLIKGLSQKFYCPNMDVAKKLCTKTANERFVLQKAFLPEWDYDSSMRLACFDKLKRMGLDLNFSYDRRLSTALLQIGHWLEAGWSGVGCWLIANGADINVCSSEGVNVSMYAFSKYDTPLMNELLDHDALKVNHQDNNGDSFLHYCFRGFFKNTPYGKQIDESRVLYMCEVVRRLLQKGADPTIKDRLGKTPLDLAYELEYQPLIDMLEQAVSDFEAQNINKKTIYTDKVE